MSDDQATKPSNATPTRASFNADAPASNARLDEELLDARVNKFSTDDAAARDEVDAPSRFSSPARVENYWRIAAGVCALAALGLWGFVGADAAFVVAALGVIAWFLGLRNRLRAANIEDEAARENNYPARGVEEDHEENDYEK